MINEIRKVNVKIHEIEEDEIIKDIRNLFRLKRNNNFINEKGDRKSLLKNRVFIINKEVVFLNQERKKPKKSLYANKKKK